MQAHCETTWPTLFCYNSRWGPLLETDGNHVSQARESGLFNCQIRRHSYRYELSSDYWKACSKIRSLRSLDRELNLQLWNIRAGDVWKVLWLRNERTQIDTSSLLEVAWSQHLGINWRNRPGSRRPDLRQTLLCWHRWTSGGHTCLWFSFSSLTKPHEEAFDNHIDLHACREMMLLW